MIDNHGLPSTAAVVNHPVDLVEQDILDLHKLSLCMRKRRYENGALSMNSIKLSFKLDDNGDVEKVWVYQLKESNRLIEEFMLRANMSVAEKLCEHYPGEAMLRRHEPPIERRLVSHKRNSGVRGLLTPDLLSTRTNLSRWLKTWATT